MNFVKRFLIGGTKKEIKALKDIKVLLLLILDLFASF